MRLQPWKGQIAENVYAIAFYPYDHELIRGLVLRAKVHRDPWALTLVSKLWGRALRTTRVFLNEPFLPVPRPLLRWFTEGPGLVPTLAAHPLLKHLRRARGISAHSPLPWTRYTQHLSSRTEFRRSPTAHQPPLLIIDDVLTTGETLRRLGSFLETPVTALVFSFAATSLRKIPSSVKY